MKRTSRLIYATVAAVVALTVYRLAESLLALIPVASAALAWCLVGDWMDLREARRRQAGGDR